MQITVNGIATHYTIDGPAGAPVLTMSNSLATTHRMWDSQIAALARKFRVLRYDTRGHGQTATTAGAYTMAQLAEDIGALLAALGIGRTHFVGLSMGGMIGQTLALDHPGLIESLVLADTSNDMAPLKPMWSERIATAGTSGASGVAPLVEELVERWFTPAFLAARPDVIDAVRAMIRATTTEGFIGCCHALHDFGLGSRIGAIGVPTQIVVGQHDERLRTPSEQMRALIPGARLDVLEGAAHLSNIEKAERFNAVLLRFYAGL